MYSDPGSSQQIRSRLRSDTTGLSSEGGGGGSSSAGASNNSSGNTNTVSPSSRETLNSLDQFSQQRAAYSEGEWNADDTDAESNAGGGAAAGASQDWELRSTVAKLKKMSLRTFRLWR